MQHTPATSQASFAPARATRWEWVLVAALCGLSMALKFVANAPRHAPGHGDAYYYFTLAQNLVQGRGFVVDYVFNLWSGAERLPMPANTYWMPLSSIAVALPMALFGSTYAVAQATMIVISSLAPLTTWLLTRELQAQRRLAVLAAALTVAWHGFLNSACAPQSHGLVLVLGSAALWAMLRARRSPGMWYVVGLLIALLQLTRSDGLLYFVPALVCFWSTRSGAAPGSWRLFLRVPLAWAVGMLPFWIHSICAYGAPQPPGLLHAALMTNYQELYALPQSLGLERLREIWPGAFWQVRAEALQTNLDTLLNGMSLGGKMPGVLDTNFGVQLLVWLCWAGWAFQWRRAYWPAWSLLLAMFALYTLVFPSTGLASLRSALYALYPVWMLGAVLALEGGMRLLCWPWRATRAALLVRSLLLAALVGFCGLGNFLYAKTWIANNVRFLDRAEVFHQALLEQVIEPYQLRAGVSFAWDVHDLHSHTGLRLVSMPYEQEPQILATARRLGVNFVFLCAEPGKKPIWPGLAQINASPQYERLFSGEIEGREVRLWRIKPQ